MIRMDEINKIRKAFFTDGDTKNAIALKFSRSWETIHRIVSMEREKFQSRGARPNRKPRVMTPEVVNAIQAYLDEEVIKNVKKKQRYTAQVIYAELRAKGIYNGSIRRLQETVKRLREKNNQSKKQSFLPLNFILGSALQVDHGEVDIIVNGHRFTGYLFIASVPGYALRYCQTPPK